MITFGKKTRPESSSIETRVIELPLGHPDGTTLMRGQRAWAWEYSRNVPFVFIVIPWPVRVLNQEGVMRKSAFGLRF